MAHTSSLATTCYPTSLRREASALEPPSKRVRIRPSARDLRALLKRPARTPGATSAPRKRRTVEERDFDAGSGANSPVSPPQNSDESVGTQPFWDASVEHIDHDIDLTPDFPYDREVSLDEARRFGFKTVEEWKQKWELSLIHISEPTRRS